MNKLRKQYQKVENIVMAFILRLLGNKGMLRHIEDKRDFVSEFGGSLFYKTKQTAISLALYIFRQINNICVFASGVLGLSEQLGIRFSVRFATKLARKLGMTNGNGFSYQRAWLEIITKYGAVPYEDCPDEDMSNWNEYSKWTTHDQYLLDNVAPQFKMSTYRVLKNENAILEALDNGYIPLIASAWYSDMNSPRGPLYYLKMIGRYIGGHAYRLTGYRNKGMDYETLQTFGKQYGQDGKAWLESTFGKGYFTNYIVEYEGKPTMPVEKLLPTFLEQNKGKMVKCVEDSACYVIDGGVKKWVSGADEMKTYFHLEKTKGLTIVKKQLLEAVPRGEDYPLIK